MSVSSLPNRRFLSELDTFTGQSVEVQLINGTTYTGFLRAVSRVDGSIILSDVTTPERTYARLLITGHSISEIRLLNPPFDISGLFNELSRIFQSANVRFFRERGIIKVLDRITVTEEGVIGTGPVADRVRLIFEQFKKSVTQP